MGDEMNQDRRADFEPTREQLEAFIQRAHFRHGWENLESWARRMAEQAVEEINELQAEVQALREDAQRYRKLCDILHSAKAGGGLEVNERLQVCEIPEGGKEVRLYWYPDTSVGFYEVEGATITEVIDAAKEQEK